VKVLVSATSLAPNYGGPAFSVSQQVRALSEIGVEVGVWTADNSVVDTPLLYDGPFRRLTGTPAQAFLSFGRPDVIHDNGLWLAHNHGWAMLAAREQIPRVVSTRGMLEPWAFSHKRLKKTLAWIAYQRADLQRAAALHATASAEAANLGRYHLKPPVSVIANGVETPEPEPVARSARSGPRIALFMGRLYPVKGLPMLVAAWARARPDGWTLQIAGPDEAGHRAEIEQAVKSARLTAEISFLGPVEGDEKRRAFHDADLFILPSYSESFGMAIGEALAHGLPVLTTTGAPWPVLVTRNCGWWCEPTIDGVEQGLRAATALPRETLRSMGERGRELIRADFSWGAAARGLLALYEGLATTKDRLALAR